MKITDDLLFASASEARNLWLISLPTDEDIPEMPCSQSFEKKMKKTMWKYKQLHSVKKLTRRVAVLVLVATTIAFSCLMTAEAYRTHFFHIVTGVFSDLTQFSISSSLDNTATFCDITFPYLPDGTTELFREINETSLEQTIYFADNEQHQMYLTQHLISDAKTVSIMVDTENANVSIIFIKEKEAILVQKKHTTTLLWEDGEYILLLSGNFLAQEIIQVAVSSRIH